MNQMNSRSYLREGKASGLTKWSRQCTARGLSMSLIEQIRQIILNNWGWAMVWRKLDLLQDARHWEYVEAHLQSAEAELVRTSNRLKQSSRASPPCASRGLARLHTVLHGEHKARVPATPRGSRAAMARGSRGARRDVTSTARSVIWWRRRAEASVGRCDWAVTKWARWVCQLPSDGW